MMMMLKSRADFIKRARADNKTIAAANSRMEKQIQRLYKNYRAQVLALIRDDRNFSRSGIFDLAVAGETVSQLTKLLEEAGRDDVIGAFVDEFPAITIQAREYFKQFGELPKLGGTSAEALDSYIVFSETKLKTFMDAKLVQPIQEGLFFGNMPRDTLIDTISSIAEDLSPRQAVTLVDDSFRRYQRDVTAVTGQEAGLEVWWYQGPDDAITSDQCEAILNDAPHGAPGMYFRDEISIDMHPDLRDDPFIAGGHFNCRHKFYPITLEFAESQGFKA